MRSTHLLVMVVAEWRLRGRGAVPLMFGLFQVRVSGVRDVTHKLEESDVLFLIIMPSQGLQQPLLTTCCGCTH